MFVVRLLKWLTGYLKIVISGRFPERFVNLAARKGLNLWNMVNENNDIIVFAKRSDLNELYGIAEKTGNTCESSTIALSWTNAYLHATMSAFF